MALFKAPWSRSSLGFVVKALRLFRNLLMKKINFKINLSIFSMAAFMSVAAQSQTCPIAPTQVKATVQSKVTYDKKSQLYTYSYTISNSRDSSLGIADVALILKNKPLNILGPQKWLPDFVSYRNGASAVYWSTANKAANIKVGGSLSGFSFQSPNPPGVAKLLVEGNADVPSSVPTATDDEPEPDCPGFFNDREPLDDRVTLITEGPEDHGSRKPRHHDHHHKKKDRP